MCWHSHDKTSNSFIQTDLSLDLPNFGYTDHRLDSAVITAYLQDTTIIANPVTCKAKVNSSVQNIMFPDTVNTPTGLNLTAARLDDKGMFNEHSYYESYDVYYWPDARYAATGVGEPLATITNALMVILK